MRRKRKNNKKYNRKYIREKLTKKKEIRYSLNKILPFTVPRFFSLRKNPEETIEFFNSILRIEALEKKHTRFFIDSSGVEEVTVDAIMYLIAIISDIRVSKIYGYTFSGNFPKCDSARKIYEESGFMSYVTCYSEHKRNSNNKISVIKGSNSNPKSAKEACLFVQNHCNKTRIETMPLYSVLVEMMNNTTQHAYRRKKNFLSRNWYLFCEAEKDKVNFVFLDTGLGIPTTVYKTLREQMKQTVKNSDSEYIKSALNGKFRSQTNKPNRSRGLPQISECFMLKTIDDVLVMSGYGCCRLHSTNDVYETYNNKNKLLGTLFCWSVRKEKK